MNRLEGEEGPPQPPPAGLLCGLPQGVEERDLANWMKFRFVQHPTDRDSHASWGPGVGVWLPALSSWPSTPRIRGQ